MRNFISPFSNRLQQNAIFGALPSSELERLIPDLELVPLSLGQVLFESNAPMSHAYFPLNSIVSLLYVMDREHSAEVALVGSEGMVGISMFLGGGSASTRAVVQNAGYALQLKGESLRQLFYERGSMHRLLLRYCSTVMTQIVQTSACGRHHSLTEQFSRWILMVLDRLSTNRVYMPEQTMCQMLGQPIEEIQQVIDEMQTKGILQHKEDELTVLKRHDLERRACNCYSALKDEIGRVLPSTQQPRQPGREPHGPLGVH